MQYLCDEHNGQAWGQVTMSIYNNVLVKVYCCITLFSL